MIRDIDEPIPTDEKLYRSVAAEHVADNHVLPDAVELPRCSFNRAKYSSPEDVLVESRPTENGILWLCAGDLPEPVPRETSAGEPYEFFTADDPTEDNEAHAEVRVRPKNGTFNLKAKISSKTTKAKAKAALAAKLRVHRPPE